MEFSITHQFWRNDYSFARDLGERASSSDAKMDGEKKEIKQRNRANIIFRPSFSSNQIPRIRGTDVICFPLFSSLSRLCDDKLLISLNYRSRTQIYTYPRARMKHIKRTRTTHAHNTLAYIFAFVTIIPLRARGLQNRSRLGDPSRPSRLTRQVYY